MFWHRLQKLLNAMKTFRSNTKYEAMETAVQTNVYEPVGDFYAGKSVFITGSTGFLGKVLLEKLLYTCKNIDQIYVLVREKKGTTSEQRMQQMIDTPIFSRLKSMQPQALKKITPIVGDMNLPGLGISPQDLEIIQEKVSVVFHVAAIIKFHEALNVAVHTNITGTTQVLNLCKRMKNIKVFVHFSTAYTNTDQKILEEKVYPPPADLNELMTFLEQPDHDQNQIEALLKGRTTYEFTKALAEHYISENHGTVPTIIIRPSIVTPSVQDPLPGWVDNWFGATGIITASVKGANRVIFGSPHNVLDLIPVDYVCNLAVVAAARCNSSDSVTVHNCCTSSCNPITIDSFYQLSKKVAVKIGFDDNSYSFVVYTEHKWLLNTLTFLLQTMPAYMADLILQAIRQQPRYMKIQSRIIFGRKLLDYFTSNSWEMKAHQARVLYASLSAEDKRQFPCDPSIINWEEYIPQYIEGIKRFLF